MANKSLAATANNTDFDSKTKGKYFMGIRHGDFGDIGFCIIDKNVDLVEFLLEHDTEERNEIISQIMRDASFRFSIAGETNRKPVDKQALREKYKVTR